MAEISPLAQAIVPRFSDFRRSDNVEDRRDEGFLSKLQAYASMPSLDDFKEMIRHPLTPLQYPTVSGRYAPQPIPPLTPLAIEAGANQIGTPSFGSMPAAALGQR